MATSTQIKSDNNTLIRVKTTAKSITKTNVADQLDAGIDYAVQELALKVDKVSGKSLISDSEITRLANVNEVPAKTSGLVNAINGSRATLLYDINKVDKSGGSEVNLPTTTEVGKEVLFLALNYSGTVSVYVNDAGDVKLSGGTNGVSGNQQNLQINTNEAYRFIYRENGYWFFEKIIDIPTNYYQLVSERTTDGTLNTNSNFKYPTEQAVKTYVDNKQPYKKYVALISQTGVSDPVVTTLLENTLSNVIVWTRTSAGLYYGTLTGEFTNLKTWCMICPISTNGVWSLYPVNDNQVQLKTWEITTQTNVDGYLNETSIEIRVYN